MDHIQTIVLALNEEEKKDFLHFVQRYSERENRKDLELFHLLSHDKDYTRAELLKIIYPK